MPKSAAPGMPGTPLPGMPGTPLPGVPGTPLSAGMTGVPPHLVASGLVKQTPLTTVYIGRLPPGLDDDFVRSLLEQCGRVIKWNRASDPNSGKFTTFGFCEFESLEGVWHAGECLHDKELLSKQILVKCEEKSAAQVEDWKTQRKQEIKKEMAQRAMEGKEENGEKKEGEDVKMEDAEGDASAAGVIKKDPAPAGGPAETPGGSPQPDIEIP